jgi:feruloyl esterase
VVIPISYNPVRAGIAAVSAALLIFSLANLVSATPTGKTGSRCEALANADFAGVSEAPTQILSAEVVAATETLPEQCRVTGYVNPQVGFELTLPVADWNGKFIHVGSGGHGGTIRPTACSMPLARGYACLQSDMGHKGTGLDAKWAYNNLQAELDWGYRATHVATVAGKAVTEGFYRKLPSRSYFSGCSTGGRQALQAVQRFPWDFDGIIAGAPPIRLADLYVTFAWGQRATRDVDGNPILGIDDLKLLTEGALARCDMDDGVHDGVISSPFECPFRASDLACKSGNTTGCLTPEKVRAAEQVYSGPVDANSSSLFGAGALPGSEYGGPWNAQYGGNWGIYYLGKDGAPALYAPLTEEGLKYLFFSPDRASDWTIQQFDFDSDYKRLDVMQSLYDSSNPDLNRFRAAGGKMLIYHGLNDLSILPHWIIEYYQKVERVMGGREDTQSFVRLFSLPGVEHCGRGAGADTIDYLTYLESWVEQGKAPDELIAYRLKRKAGYSAATFPIAQDEIEFSRPVYPYPIKAKYLGHGDPNSAENFGPVEP